ncbi:MAG: hypothetical protein COA47_02490 [Robiginitomaculum sp.]|nr:MAG: hypothetical protein COA47_02490 [Robiginitomaculum sp.]
MRLGTKQQKGFLISFLWVLSAVAASAQTRIDVFSPTGEAKQVKQVKVRFSNPMSQLGDPRQDSPFEARCSVPGTGRWVDTRNWVYEFKTQLPSGNKCTFSPISGLRDVAGNRVTGKSSYSFNTGGPAIKWSQPYDGNSRIAEDQYFQLQLDGEVDPASVQQLAWCNVEGLAEKIPLQVLPVPEGKDQRKFLIWTKCANTLPPATKVRLVWEKGIASPSGVKTSTRQTFNFKIRPQFRARFTCSRTSVKEPCSPLSDLSVQFSAPIALGEARKITLQQGAQTIAVPDIDADRERGSVQNVRFKGPFAEDTSFQIILPTDVRDDADRPLKNQSAFPLDFATGKYPPLIKFSGNFGILEQKTGGVLPVSIRGVESPVPGTSISIARQGQFIQSKEPFEILNWMKRIERVKWGKIQQADGKWTQIKNDPHPSLFRPDEDQQSFKMPDALGDKALEVIGIPLTDPGFYVVELKSQILGDALIGKQRTYHVATSALVTNMAVHFLWGADRSAIWVTQLNSGQPVANAKIAIGNECSKQILWQGETDKDGLVHVQNELPSAASWASCYGEDHPPLIVTAQKGDDFSFTRTEWNKGLQPWEFGIDTGYEGSRLLAHSVLDRSLFRAGETVSMKHFLRRTNSNGLELLSPSPQDTKLQFIHMGSGQDFSFPIEFDASGRAQSQWKIPKDARLGSYEVSILGKNDLNVTSGRFRIEEFKVPTMQAFLTGPDQPMVSPSQIEIKAMVRYLAGGGASGQPVRLISDLGTDWQGFENWSEFSFGYQSITEGIFKRGEQIGDKEPTYADDQKAILNANGSTNIIITDLPQIKRRHSLSAELEYKDANGEILTRSTRFRLWPAAVALGIKTEGWAASDSDLKFQVLAIDVDEKPIIGQTIAVELYRQKNLSWRKRMIGGYYAYENERHVTKLDANCAGKTDKNGRLRCKLKPGISGEVILRATALDKDGNQTITTSSIWLVGEDDWWFDQQQGDRMDLLVENVEMEDGDTARIQVRSPFRSATALVSIEREGVIDTFVTKISGRNPVINVPIKGTYAPNIYVSVLAVRGRVGKIRTWMADMAREYDIPWFSRDGGRPTGLIDLSKPAFRLGLTNIKVGHKAFRLNVDVSTDQDSYQIRGIAKVTVKVKAADGNALPDNSQITLAVVDAGLLQMAPNTSSNVLAALMKTRGLQVFTSTAQMQVIGKRHFGRKAVAPGGGGEADAMMMEAKSMAVQPGGSKPRESFDTLLIWKGTVKLDANGEAVIDVPINDSLTAFEVVAVANGGVEKFGFGKSRFTVTQDLQLISALPPLIRENDLFSAAFTVRNTTNTAQNVIVEAQNSIGRTLEPITLTLAAGEASEARWQVLIPFDQTKVDWQISVTVAGNDQPSDSLKVSQTIIPALPVTVMQSTIARLNQPQSWPVSRPVDALPGRGGLDIRLQSRLADGFAGVDAYMQAYPYSCYEQRTSVAIALNDSDRWQALMAATPAFIDSDGLLKYFVSDRLQGSDTLTAYALKIAEEAGWQFDPAVKQQLLGGLTAFVEGRLTRRSALQTSDLTYRKLSAINALARYGQADPQSLTSLEFSAQLLPTSALLDWIGILQHVNSIVDRDNKLRKAQGQLRVRLDLTGTRINFSTENSDRLYWLMETIDANAARTLLSTYQQSDWQDDAPRLSLGLLGRQKWGRWQTTTANAWGMLAMRKFSDRFEKETVTGRTRIQYDSQTRSTIWKGDQNPAPTEFDWNDGAGTLDITHQGNGTPWVFVTAKAAVPLKQPLSAGYRITRTIEAVEQAQANSWHVGDVMKIRLEVHANSDMTWVVIDDPVPAGATILGGGLQTSSNRLSQNRSSGSAWPIFTEQKFEAWRSYYRFVPAGDFSVEYTVRLNTPGRYNLPPSRVEAMYAPEMFGATPIAELVIEP